MISCSTSSNNCLIYVSKCIGSLCQINRVKHLFDRSTLITIINSLVFSKLFYCSSTWASTTKKNIARLQKVQNFAARIVTGAREYDHITPILKELHWLPVAKQLEVRDTLMALKCIKGLAPPSLCNKFTTRSQVHNRNTRNNDKLNIPFFRSATGQRSFSYRAAQLWNDLPEILTNIVSFNVFKNAIKRRALDEFLSHLLSRVLWYTVCYYMVSYHIILLHCSTTVYYYIVN